jgi:hypothetical protein
MKKLITLLLLSLSLTSFAQNIKFKMQSTAVTGDIAGGTISKGDEFFVYVQANGNANTTTRQLMFDLQYDQVNFQLMSVEHTGTGGNGGVLPQNSNPTLSYTNYPGFQFNSTSTSTSGWVIYQNTSYPQNSSNAIIRATLTWATTSGMPFASYDNILKIKFKLKATSTATSFNPIKLNFVVGWNAGGAADNTTMETPLSTSVILDQSAGKFVTANVDINSNLLSLSNIKVSFKDTLTNQGQLFNVLADGKVDVNQSLLSENKVYEVSVMHEMDKMYPIYNGAITLSDFTTAQGEFTSMGLDGSNGQILKTGQSLYAADINRNKTIDGGDLPQLLAQVVGVDTLFTLPTTYSVGSGGYMSLPTWKAAQITTLAGTTEWGYVSVGNTFTTLYIDMREFPNGVNPNQLNSVQLFDLYTGPVEFLSQDASWAQYKIPTILSKVSDGTSTFQSYIRNIQGNDYAFKIEFDFNINPSQTWSSITTSNWKDLTYPKTYFKTGVLGSNAILDLKYLLWGDVNRSHSSQVVVLDQGVSTVQTNAKSSLLTNTAFKVMSLTTPLINTPYNITSIEVNLSNVTVTSNSVEIPVSIDTKGASVGGLQFEFQFDPSKIKFEELKSEVPNTWYIFANSKSGKVKFGALDQNGKSPIKGTNTPFKLKFSTIGNGVDILTSVKVSPTMDASSTNGSQLGINLNTTQIKLVGYNNF